MKLQTAKQVKMLVAEDHVLAKSHIKYALEQLGFQHIDYVDKASDAFNAISNKQYDVVMCAYDLKEEQAGFYLYERLHAESLLPLTSAFVFTSADTSSETVHAIIELQPDEFIAKPFSVNELDKRLGRVIARKQALAPIYQLMDSGEFSDALGAVERFLLEPKHAHYYPLALKIKGDLLLLCERYNEALGFFESIINVQPFSWATLGLVQCYIQQNEFDIAEKTLIHLALQNNRLLVAYDMLAELQIKQNAFEEALECIDVANDISPRSIARQQKAVELSRLTHDYEAQYNSAKKVVRFARNSIHDKPDIYLSAARAGVDYAMTAEPELTRQIVKQSSDYLDQLKAAHAKAEVQNEVNVINARVLYLKDDMESAKALLNTVDADALSAQSPEALIDAAKAFNDVGLKKSALQILDTLEKKLENDDTANTLLFEYVKQEKAEKTAISVSPKNLNNAAVLHYQKGEISKSFETFEQAFKVMPKNAAIALNLLQATVMRKKRKSGNTQGDERLIKQCRETLENAKLTEEQHIRYENIKLILRQVA